MIHHSPDRPSYHEQRRDAISRGEKEQFDAFWKKAIRDTCGETIATPHAMTVAGQDPEAVTLDGNPQREVWRIVGGPLMVIGESRLEALGAWENGMGMST